MPKGSNWSSRTHCLRGHEYNGTNSARRVLADGSTKVYRYRRCLTCDRNARRSPRGVLWRRFLTHCKRGHAYEGENLGVVVMVSRGREREYRRCKACRRDVCARAMRKWRAKVAARAEARA